MEMTPFICAIRSGDWALHLEALEVFTKHFSTHNMLNYTHMIPVYLAEMQMLSESDPEIYAEFKQGNWVVNKKYLYVSFCAVGPVNALEHINWSMKVSGRLVEITFNPSARTKYFLIAPKLARLAEQAKQMANSSFTTPKHHRRLATAVRLLQGKNIEQLTITIRGFMNPFLEESSNLKF